MPTTKSTAAAIHGAVILSLLYKTTCCSCALVRKLSAARSALYPLSAWNLRAGRAWLQLACARR